MKYKEFKDRYGFGHSECMTILNGYSNTVGTNATKIFFAVGVKPETWTQIIHYYCYTNRYYFVLIREVDLIYYWYFHLITDHIASYYWEAKLNSYSLMITNFERDYLEWVLNSTNTRYWSSLEFEKRAGIMYYEIHLLK